MWKNNFQKKNIIEQVWFSSIKFMPLSNADVDCFDFLHEVNSHAYDPSFGLYNVIMLLCKLL